MYTRLISQTVLWYGVIGGLLFLSAGTLDWPAAWIFLLGMMVLSLILGVRLAQLDPGLLNERLRAPIQTGQPLSDKLVTSLLLLIFVSSFPLIGFDVRFGWSDVPHWVRYLGLIAIVLGLVVCYRTFRANSFAAPVVKIQDDRGQSVVTSGPYAVVRHPLYAGALLFFIGVPLLLGSFTGLAFVPLLCLILALRIRIEEATLVAALPDYEDYRQRTRFRLIPGIW
jgi:protein-S-isoprenylcysteine O-methyltransferase Ste14